MAKSFNQVSELREDTLMIVDSLNLAFRWKHARQLTFVDDFLKNVESLRKSYKAKYVAITSDWGSSSYRKNIYPDYKGNRTEKMNTQTEEEALEFQLFLEEFNNVIAAYQEQGNFPVFRYKKVEADDIAAFIVRVRRLFPKIKKIVLISSDRDWDLLIKEEVIRFSYVTRKETTLANFEEIHGCKPEEYIHIKCLMGDTGDNVPGVPKIGPVTAKKLIDKYGTGFDIAASLPINSKYVYIKNLNDFGADNLLRNYQLMDLEAFCEDAVGEENTNCIIETLGTYINE